MNSEFKILMGYDDLGVVYDAHDFVLRKTLPVFQDRANEIYQNYKKFDLKKIGIVETDLAPTHGENYFKHKKHLITYPHEWTVSMFKDAALFHLDLFQNLDKFNLGLKDAHPHNILFDKNNFTFIDFLSLSTLEDLHKEQSLVDFAGSKNDPRFKEPRYIVFDEMFFPEFFVPLVLMSRKEYSNARNILCFRGRNCAATVPTWEDLSAFKDFRSYIKIYFENLKIKFFLKRERKKKFGDFCAEVKNLIKNLNVTPHSVVYDNYYKDKRESFSFEYSDNWKDKQKNVYSVINKFKPKSILDVGANTGWFSILGAKEGAQVIATDIEESSIDCLYAYSKKNKENIIPLLLPFEKLTTEVYGAYDSRLDFKSPKENPLFSAGTERLQSDMVLFLALIHHLVLGGHVDLRGLFEVLNKLTKKVLILEYVGLDDKLVNLHSSSFPQNRDIYFLENVINEGKKYFSNVEILDSTPSTRKLLIFIK